MISSVEELEEKVKSSVAMKQHWEVPVTIAE
jgi:hypothetical protein